VGDLYFPIVQNIWNNQAMLTKKRSFFSSDHLGYAIMGSLSLPQLMQNTPQPSTFPSAICHLSPSDVCPQTTLMLISSSWLFKKLKHNTRTESISLLISPTECASAVSIQEKKEFHQHLQNHPRSPCHSLHPITSHAPVSSQPRLLCWACAVQKQSHTVWALFWV
jgi:hypothetical protein